MSRMKKKDRKSEEKWKRMIGIGAVSVTMMLVIFIAFTINFNKIYGLLLEKDMEQVRSTSGFVTKLISTEIENLQAALDSSQRLFLQTDDVQDEKSVGYLNDIQKKFGFEKVGISDLEGNSLDNTGKREKLNDDKMFREIRNKQKYISNVMNVSDIMLLAVPFYRDNRVEGVIWGHASISRIMVVKHTNDIPFEINFSDNTLTIYRNTGAEEILVREIDYYMPENMLARGRITSGEYPTYKEIFDHLTTGQKMEPVVFKFKINEKWDYHKIHIKTVSQERVIGFLEDYNEQMVQEQRMEEIRVKSQTDSLTGLYNREYFVRECVRCIKDGKHPADGKVSALFLLDLDHFKLANDTLGHMTGDQILKECGRKLRAVIRETDLAGRLGGDEFVLFIKNVKDVSSVHICAEKINRVLRCTYGTGTRNVAISASMGVAVWTEESSFEELYQLADKALYMAKDKGRDQYQILSQKTANLNQKE